MPATTPLDQVARSAGGRWRRSAANSRLAIGRAPIVNTSRRMPPTPVAAPWYGSMNDGWLWLSILNTTARPSPMSTHPGVLAGPLQDARAAWSATFRVHARALVAAVLGPHRPRTRRAPRGRRAAEDRCRSAAHSSAVRPCSAAASTVTAASRPDLPSPVRRRSAQRRLPRSQVIDQGTKDLAAVLATDGAIAGVLGVRHHAEDVAARVHDAGDRAEATRWGWPPASRVPRRRCSAAPSDRPLRAAPSVASSAT